jgi:hypothetical protein
VRNLALGDVREFLFTRNYLGVDVAIRRYLVGVMIKDDVRKAYVFSGANTGGVWIGEGRGSGSF